MKALFVGDVHVKETDIPELTTIFEEDILPLIDKNTEVIQVGDYYDTKRPSASETYFGTSMVHEMQIRAKNVSIIYGNHDEVALRRLSSISYLEFLEDNGQIVIPNIKHYFKNHKVFIGHFFVKGSSMDFDDSNWTLEDIRKEFNPNWVLLGHQHKFQELDPKAFHVGNLLYKNFGELGDPFKRVTMIENGKLKFIELKSVIPMVEITNVKELDKIPERTKVRVSVKSFDQYKRDIGKLKKWDGKFYEFKIKLDFDTKTVSEKPKATSSDTILYEWLKNIEDTDVKSILEKEFNVYSKD